MILDVLSEFFELSVSYFNKINSKLIIKCWTHS